MKTNKKAQIKKVFIGLVLTATLSLAVFSLQACGMFGSQNKKVTKPNQPNTDEAAPDEVEDEVYQGKTVDEWKSYALDIKNLISTMNTNDAFNYLNNLVSQKIDEFSAKLENAEEQNFEPKDPNLTLSNLSDLSNLSMNDLEQYYSGKTKDNATYREICDLGVEIYSIASVMEDIFKKEFYEITEGEYGKDWTKENLYILENEKFKPLQDIKDEMDKLVMKDEDNHSKLLKTDTCYTIIKVMWNVHSRLHFINYRILEKKYLLIETDYEASNTY